MSYYKIVPKSDYTKMKDCHTAAYQHINKALEQDEDKQKGNKTIALKYYRTGLKELEKGVRIEGRGKDDEEEDKIAKLRDRMIKNMELCRGRISDLIAGDSSPNSSFPGATPGSSKQVYASIRKTNLTRQPLSSTRKSRSNDEQPNEKRHHCDGLKGVDPQMIQTIIDEIIDCGPSVSWNDVVGLDLVKRTLEETVILPTVRPELFTGLRSPVKGLLLFGPPGNGKTMMAKAIASASNATFFCISASSLTSKWLGESEKLVRALFAVARHKQPSIIFIDEVDSILSRRGEREHDAMRRLKNEFLLSFDGMQSSEADRILVMAATNRPEEIDEAALRRFVKRIYVPLPQPEARKIIISNLLKKHDHLLNDKDLDRLAMMTDNYSASDLTALARDAAFGPIRGMNMTEVTEVSSEDVRPISYDDFVESMKTIRPSVSPQSLKALMKWSRTYGAT